jgi:uncharacterized phage protein (TIGR01671 family)
MRNLKFRAWDDIKKEWLLGYKECGGFSIMGECMMMGEWESVLSRMAKGCFGEEGEKLIVQQSTGLKDIDGVEIYEGDILQNQKYDEIKRFVRWATDMEYAGWSLARSTTDLIGDLFIYQNMVNLKVIGNIFENPELLK